MLRCSAVSCSKMCNYQEMLISYYTVIIKFYWALLHRIIKWSSELTSTIISSLQSGTEAHWVKVKAAHKERIQDLNPGRSNAEPRTWPLHFAVSCLWPLATPLPPSCHIPIWGILTKNKPSTRCRKKRLWRRIWGQLSSAPDRGHMEAQ